MSDRTASVTIRAIDGVSEPIRRINASFDEMMAPLDRTRRAMERLQDAFNANRAVQGIARMSDRLHRVGATAGRVGAQITNAFAPLGVLGGAASVAGLGAMVNDFASSGREISQWAARLGTSTTALQALTAVGARFGIQNDAMIDGLKELSLRADEFAETGKGGGEEAFTRLGLTPADLAAVKGDTEALFEMVRSRIEGVQDVAARQRIADEVFGGQAGEQFTEMLSTSTDELMRMRDEAERMGAILPPDAIADARSLSGGILRLQSVLDGLSKTISARLAPVLQPLIDRFTDWIVANRDLIASGVNGFVERMAGLIQQIDFEAVTAGLSRFVDGITRAVDFIGGWQNALIAVVAVMNAPLIAAIGSVVGAFAKLGAVVLANPILATVAAIAFGAYAIYANWDKIVAYFQDKFSGIQAAFSDGFLNGIVSVLYEFNPVTILADTINGMVKWLFGVDLYAIGSEWIARLWDGLADKFAAMQEWLVDQVRGLVGWMPEWVQEELGLKGFAEGAPETAGTGPDTGSVAEGETEAERNQRHGLTAPTAATGPDPMRVRQGLGMATAATLAAGPAFAAPDYAAPHYGAPTYDAPAYEAPAFSAPTFDAPDYAAPHYGAPTYDAPAYEAPAFSAPTFDAPEQGAQAFQAAVADLTLPAEGKPAAPVYNVEMAMTFQITADVDETRLRKIVRSSVSDAWDDIQQRVRSDERTSVYD